MNHRMRLIGLFVLVSAVATAVPAPGNGTRITIFATTDLHGEMSPRIPPWSGGEEVGGVAVLSGYLEAARRENPGGVVFVDAGDLMQGTLVSGRFRGLPVVRAYRRMGVDGVALGNHELDWGLLLLRERARRIPFLAANVTPDSAWRPFRIVECKGVRIALIGVAHPDTAEMTKPSAVAGLAFTDPAAAVRAVLPAVEDAGADLVVVLAHFGAEGEDFGLAGDLARALDPERVHLIVAGHTHRRATGVVNGIPILQPWPESTAFGVVDFTLDEAGRVSGFSWPYVRTTYTSHYGTGRPRWRGREVVPRRSVTMLVRRWERLVDRARRKVVGEATAPIWRDYRRESAMGDFVADVLRETGADFGLVNSGGLRADLPAGEITCGALYEVMPFDNRAVHVLLTGRDLRTVLEQGVSGRHGVIQVSGLSFAFDYDLPEGARIAGDVIDRATGRPLVPGGVYRVAVPDFLAEGGDGFTVLTTAPHEPRDALVRDLIADRLRRTRPFTPPDPAVERRMAAAGKAP